MANEPITPAKFDRMVKKAVAEILFAVTMAIFTREKKACFKIRVVQTVSCRVGNTGRR